MPAKDQAKGHHNKDAAHWGNCPAVPALYVTGGLSEKRPKPLNKKRLGAACPSCGQRDITRAAKLNP